MKSLTFLALLPLALAQYNSVGGITVRNNPPDCVMTSILKPTLTTYFMWSPSDNKQCHQFGCGGGRAPPAYNQPGCEMYTGTVSVMTERPGWPEKTDVPPPPPKPTVPAEDDDKEEEDKPKPEPPLEPKPTPTPKPTGKDEPEKPEKPGKPEETDKETKTPKETSTAPVPEDDDESTTTSATIPSLTPPPKPTSGSGGEPAKNNTNKPPTQDEEDDDKDSGALGRAVSWLALAGAGVVAVVAAL